MKMQIRHFQLGISLADVGPITAGVCWAATLIFSASPLLAAPNGESSAEDAADVVAESDPQTSTGSQDDSALVTAANSAYNKGDYAAAAEQYRALIQAHPERAIAYRNLARSYFWQETYPDAVAYYDFYLRLAPDAEDRAQIQSERRLSASRAGNQIWRTPPQQARALNALNTAIEEGLGYRPGAGGAWGIYQTLLRTGFAQPELTGLKRRLVRKLLNEFVGLLVPDANQPAPHLELDDWKVQLERLNAARRLTADPGFLSVIRRRTPLAEAAIALLTRRFEDAHALSLVAVQKNPDMPFIRWFQVRALVELTRYNDALKALDKLENHYESANPKLLEYTSIFRASTLQRMQRGDQASDIYLKLLNHQSAPANRTDSTIGNGAK